MKCQGYILNAGLYAPIAVGADSIEERDFIPSVDSNATIAVVASLEPNLCDSGDFN